MPDFHAENQFSAEQTAKNLNKMKATAIRQ
jgi:hypothetical protein